MFLILFYITTKIASVQSCFVGQKHLQIKKDKKNLPFHAAKVKKKERKIR